MRRKLHGNAVFRAFQLLNVQRKGAYIWLRDSWVERLLLAGVCPDSVQVVEPRRCARAWKLLVDTWRFRKSDAVCGNTLDLDAPWPPEPIIRGPRKMPWEPKKEPRHKGPDPRKAFDPTARFRRKIWTPNDERTALADSVPDSWEEAGLVIPDEQASYGTVIPIHNVPSW
jgi:hypothetical protein